ncbi:MAG TPA: LapA family protein [Acidimicrobiales bacterium]
MTMKSEDGGTSASQNVKRFGPAAILTLVALIFVFQNTHKAKFEFLFWDLEWATWLILLVTLAVGFLIGWFGHIKRARRD